MIKFLGSILLLLIVGCDNQEDKKFHDMSFDDLFAHTDVFNLAKAVEKEDLTFIKDWHEKGRSFDQYGNENATVLYWALENRKFHSFKSLLELGANPNIPVKCSKQIYCYELYLTFLAIDNKQLSYFEKLLEFGANPNQLNFNGKALIQRAIETGDQQNIEMLLAFGADVNIVTDQYPFPPVYMVVILRKYHLFDLLMVNGASIEEVENVRFTFAELVDREIQFAEKNLVSIPTDLLDIKRKISGS
ncbi:ankyrin repeat domain-containing protein [Curvivirga aplysinae]|uniref:ankyrin repeat domain-containing protein n=1 Tax=Curvivirga aplysinae TaxID=2529852 RepID=UPI0012BBA693|nr:hypothetical protein [Curvivirga aplysinae]MTI10340.1 ankyrin repeat domain-containing protein [Curvivirga aplysinae]